MKQEATEGGTRAAIEGSAVLQALLKEAGLSTEDVADYHRYPIADNNSPGLSADRLEYTLGNLVNYGFAERDRIRWMLDALAVLRDEAGQPELGFLRREEALSFARGALAMGRIYVSEPDRYAMQALAELLGRAVHSGAIRMEDLWLEEPRLLEKLCRTDPFRQEWARYRRCSRIVHEEGGLVVRAKKRYIDPLVCGLGRVSRLEPAFGAEVAAFLAEPQDAPLVGMD